MFSRRPGFRFNRGRFAAGVPAAGGGGGDTTKPQISGNPAVAVDGTYIDVTLNEACNTGAAPAAGSFVLGGTPATVASTAWQSPTVARLTLLGFIIASETVTFSYTQGANPIQDVAGNLLDNVAGQAVTNSSTARLAGVIRTLLAGETVSGLAANRSLTLIAWGAGSGGDGDNNTGQSAAGAGGACAVKEVAVCEGSYTFSRGTGGALGLLGTSSATNGTASTWTDSGGTACQAAGGIAGAAHLTTPTASIGGSTGVGDTINAGGAGATGAVACPGGGSAGTTGAGGTPTAGTPNGVRGIASNVTAPPSTGGGVNAAGIAVDGGHGFGEIYAPKVADAAYPWFDPTATFFVETTNATTRNLVRPGTHVAGDRLLMIGGIDGAGGGLSAMSGWATLTEQADAADNAALLVFAIDSTGSESMTLTSASEQGSYWMFRIKNADPVANWSITPNQKASGVDSNPPSHTHPAGSKPALWITAVAFDGTGTTAANGMAAFPAGWDFLTLWSHAKGNSAGPPGLLIAAKITTDSVQDPPAFTHSTSTVGGIMTMAIPLLES